MAIVTTILKKTHQEVTVKVAGTGAASTVALADLVATGQALDGATQTVNIIGATWTGAADGVITITRNSVVIMTLQANAAGMLYFDGQSMVPDSIQNTSDIVITVSGAQAEVWLKLRKVSGYKTTIEPEQFGPYDNPAVAGS